MDHRKIHFVLLGVTALMASMPAFAQSTATTAQPAATSAQPAGEIIVTAQRRGERARDVPITLTVLTPDTLKASGVDTIRDLHNVTPGLRIDRNGVSVQPSIRGVTALDGNPGNDANVAIYVDGVYQPNPAANNLDLPDVERIEVLKGPQGTLFGRNATGGAIRVETRNPSFTPTADLDVGYGSYNDFLIKGYASAPIVKDVVALGISLYHEQNDGYLHDMTNGGALTGGLATTVMRAKLLITPSEKLNILITGQFQSRDDGSMAGQPYDGNTIARGVPGVIIPTQPWEVANNHDPRVDIRQSAVSAHIDYDLGFAKINSISAFNHVYQYSPVEGDYTNIDLSFFYTTAIQNTFSQELNLTSNGSGPLKWVVGGFYYHDRARFDPLAVSPPASLFNIYGGQNTDAYAAFGELTYNLTHNLMVIGGLRYSSELRQLTGNFGVREFPVLAEKRFSSATPRVTVRYAVTPTTNLYATYSEGFKSGGYTASSLSTTPFLPEKLYAWEAGIKSAPDRAISFNAAGFYYNYTNEQVQSSVELSNGSTVGSTTNAAKSRIYGAEFDTTLRPWREFSVNAGVSWLHARYLSFPDAYVDSPIKVGGVVCLCGNVGTTVDASGNQMVRAPNATVTVTPRYKREFDVGTFDLSATVYYSDRFFFTPDDRVNQPAYTTVSARLGFTPHNLPVDFAVWGRNLTNTVVYQGASIIPGADGVLFAPPRTVGVEAHYHF